ncbi:MAG TPA: response regulator [Candidatus Saccharimonadales bacterium]|nr:response regulator [Candidatus Saccharimonadales bacterium]
MSAKILIIEPDRRLGKIYHSSLSNLGYQVNHRLSAEAALKIMDLEIPDLIIIEPQLVKHGGFEFLYELRSYQDWQAMPVIINSFIPVEVLKYMHAALDQLGVVRQLYKPDTTLKQLTEVCQTVLQPNPST